MTDTRGPDVTENAVCSETRGTGEPWAGGVSSVASRPGDSRPVADVTIRAVGAGECLAERFDGDPVDLAILLEFGEVVDEAGMDDGIGGGRSALQAVRILQSAAMHLGTGGRKCGGGSIGAGKAQDLMARIDQFPDDG